MMTRAKTASALIGAATIALLLSACSPGDAQNINPVGKVPGAQEKSQPAACAVASKAAVDRITAAVGSHDTAQVANIAKADGGWYLGAGIVPADSHDTNKAQVTIWATTSDPTKDSFTGPLYAVNKAAKDASASHTASAPPAPSSFSAGSTGARKVQSCVVASTTQ